MDSDRSRTFHLAAELAKERARVEAHLWREMGKLGLKREDGWSIVEFTREAEGGTEIVLRPLHLYIVSPSGVECIVGVVEDGAIRSECGPDSDR